jgi:hypothetical protein
MDFSGMDFHMFSYHVLYLLFCKNMHKVHEPLYVMMELNFVIRNYMITYSGDLCDLLKKKFSIFGIDPIVQKFAIVPN